MTADRQVRTKELEVSYLVKGYDDRLATQIMAKTESASVASAGMQTEPGIAPQDARPDIRAAGRALAALRHQPRLKGGLSGFVNGVRVRRDQHIRLPDGSLAYALGARRGKLVFFRDMPHVMEPGHWGVLDASLVTLLSSESAANLGMAKLGRCEVKSALKEQSARENGRRGGRPKKAVHAFK